MIIYPLQKVSQIFLFTIAKYPVDTINYVVRKLMTIWKGFPITSAAVKLIVKQIFHYIK